MSAPTREKLAERERILAAVTDEVGENGYRATSLSDILIRAEVDEATFHRHFEDMHAAFLVVWGVANERLIAEALPAFEAEPEWRGQIRAVAAAIFRFVVRDPHRARILWVEGRNPHEPVRAHHDDPNVEPLVALIDAGRQQLEDPELLTQATAEGVYGAVKEQIAFVLRDRAYDQLPQIFPSLMATVVRPYLGDEAAAEELARGAPDV